MIKLIVSAEVEGEVMEWPICSVGDVEEAIDMIKSRSADAVNVWPTGDDCTMNADGDPVASWRDGEWSDDSHALRELQLIADELDAHDLDNSGVWREL